MFSIFADCAIIVFTSAIIYFLNALLFNPPYYEINCFTFLFINKFSYQMLRMKMYFSCRDFCVRNFSLSYSLRSIAPEKDKTVASFVL